MAAADAIITRDGPVAAPMDYTVPASSELIPIVIAATFDGSAAAGSFVPALNILTPDGKSLGPYPLLLTLAAGASARVAWFPGLAATGSGSSGSAHTLETVIGGAGSVIATGVAGDVFISFDCTITAWTLLADQSGSAVVDIWKAAYGAFPPTVANTITAGTPPTLTAQQKNQGTTLAGWTTAISAGDVLRFNVNSASTVTRVTLALSLS